MTFPPDNEGLEMMFQHLHLKHGTKTFGVVDENGRPVYTWNVEDGEWTEITKYDENGRPVFTRANVLGEEDEPL